MNNEPSWVSALIAVAIHERLIEEFGGLHGIRDEALLESALAGPRHRYNYGEHDLVALAAAYAHGINRNHPFVDGNKRVGFMLAAVFLELNGFRLEAPELEAVTNTLALAAREIDESQYANWLRQHARAEE